MDVKRLNYNGHYGDVYFSEDDGLAESIHVFVRGNRLTGPRLGAAEQVSVGETGFGAGLNLAAALTALAGLPFREGGRVLRWISVEKHPLDRAEAAGLRSAFADAAAASAALADAWPEHWVPGAWTELSGQLGTLCFSAAVWTGDVLEMLGALPAVLPEGGIDAWVLDGHSPALNPDMWSPAVFAGLAAASRTGPATRFATYSAAGMVKRGLREAGFSVHREPGHGRKRHMAAGWYGNGPDPDA